MILERGRIPMKLMISPDKPTILCRRKFCTQGRPNTMSIRTTAVIVATILYASSAAGATTEAGSIIAGLPNSGQTHIGAADAIQET
jgi:hypothetical protein